MKKYFIFFATFLIILLSGFSIAPNAFGQAPILTVDSLSLPRPLENQYPEVPKAFTPTTVEQTPLARYVEYVYYFLIGASGILALLALIYAAFLYITSMGNPDKLKDAKERIFSALLGLAIVAGSWVIIWKINPQFLVFELPDIDPLIDTLAPGVLACKTGGNDILNVWILQELYTLQRLPTTISPDVILRIGELSTEFLSRGLILTNIKDIQVKKAVREEIDELLKKISDECYYINSAGPVKPEFNDKIWNFWFIPDLKHEVDRRGVVYVKSSNQYGVAVFDNDDYSGLGETFFKHMFGTVREPYVFHTHIKVSSVVPFKRYTEEETYWRVRLYQGKNFNAGLPGDDGAALPPFEDIYSLPPFVIYYANVTPDGKEFLPIELPLDLSASPTAIMNPESMKVDGKAMVILYKDAVQINKDGTWQIAEPITDNKTTPPQIGRYFKIFFDSDYNLVDDRDITKQIECPSYATDVQRCPKTLVAPGGPGGGASITTYYDCCFEAAADAIIIISNVEKL